jgi:hypothetical protein
MMKRWLVAAFLFLPLPAWANMVTANVVNEVCVTPTVTAANAYGTNFVVGGLLTFANAFNQNGWGVLRGVAVTVKKVETSGFAFTPFVANPSNTTWTDAAVAAINAADVASVRQGPVLAASSVLGTHTILSSAAGYAQAMFVGPGKTTLWGVLTSTILLTNNFGSASDVQVCAQLTLDPQ